MTARLNALRKQVREEREAIPALPWIGLVSGLVFIAPWIVFGCGVVFVRPASGAGVMAFCAVYLAVQVAMHLLVVCGPLSDKLAYRPTVVAGGVLIALGIVMSYVGGMAGEAYFPLSLLGSASCAAGVVLLVAKWYPHFARIDSRIAFTWNGGAMAVSMVAYLLSASLDTRVAFALVVAVYVVGPIVATAKVAGYAPRIQMWADTSSDSAVMTQHSKYAIMAYVTLACMVFGCGIMSEVSVGLLGVGTQNVRVLPLVLGVTVLLAYVFVRVRVFGYSETMCPLNLATFMIVVGSFLCTGRVAPQFGPCVLALGYAMLECWYIAHYSGLCRLRVWSEVSATHILRYSHTFIPVGLLLGIALNAASSAFPGMWPFAAFVLGAVFLAMYMLMFSAEVSRTRSELVAKGTASISIADIERFADERRSEYRLTKRECEVIQLMMSGYSIKSIGEELFVSQSTVKSHIATIYKKMDVHKRQEMIDIISVAIRK